MSFELQEFEGVLRDGDYVVFDYMTGTLHAYDVNRWSGQIRLPRYYDGPLPDVNRRYQLHLKDGRQGTIVIDRALTQIVSRYPTLQFTGIGQLISYGPAAGSIALQVG